MRRATIVLVRRRRLSILGSTATKETMIAALSEGNRGGYVQRAPPAVHKQDELLTRYHGNKMKPNGYAPEELRGMERLHREVCRCFI